MINISYNENDGIISCSFSGHLGADSSAEITSTIDNKINEVRGSDNPPAVIKIIFDLKDVEFIASSFIRICIATFKEVGHENYSIINTRPIIKKTFAMAGLADEMNVQ